jgi:DNA-binding response OmpR family regulator
MIPLKSGMDVCRELRKLRINSKILMVTAKDKLEDKINGLDSGADDYLIKPFSFAELLARIRALLRRGGNIQESTIGIKDLKIDLISREVFRGSDKIELTAREFSLLEYFVRNKNQVLTRTMISEQVWDIDFITDTNIIDVYVNHLRSKIDKNYDNKLIYTVRGVGYILK